MIISVCVDSVFVFISKRYKAGFSGKDSLGFIEIFSIVVLPRQFTIESVTS